MINNIKVFITDTHLRTAYYVSKSLNLKGINVIGLRSNSSKYDKSKYYKKLLNINSPDLKPESWLSEVEKLGTGEEVLIPISVQTIKLIANNKEKLKDKLILPNINFENIILTTDKLKSINYMKKINIPVPKTYSPSSFLEALDIFNSIGMPLIIKIRDEKNITPSKRYRICNDIDQCKKAYKYLSSIQPNPLVQEYIHGQGFGISILANEGKILAQFAHKRLREQFLTGGPSTYCSAFKSKKLEEYANMFVIKSKWNGIAMIEFKYNQIKDKYYFMEINPRFWGSMELARICGIDFPFLFLKWILGDIDLKLRLTNYNIIKMKYISDDLKAFYNQLCSMGGKKHRNSIKEYFNEFIDPEFSLANYNFDFRITLNEIIKSMKYILGILKNAF